MTHTNGSALSWLVESAVGRLRSERLFQAVQVDPALVQPLGESVSRAELAQAMNLVLLDDLLRRVPNGALYVLDKLRADDPVVFDHGAIRTVAWPSGRLPAGQEAIARILRPLGFEVSGTYPLDALKMTGRSFCHRDFPETIAQFFVSELHPERFSPEFQETVGRVLAPSRDPLSSAAIASLDKLSGMGTLPRDEARRLLPEIVSAFDRQHALPSLADYEALLAESREMAWIATEGNAFNHATDRVGDVLAVAERQKRLGRPMKEQVEVSASGRVVQTALRAARVERGFVDANGELVLRSVPGSFFEFITRHRGDDGRLDLGFDTSNAQGIFKMTEAAA